MKPVRQNGTVRRVIKLFLPQVTLEEWALAERADLQEGSLVVGSEQARFPLLPAVHFAKLVSGADDKMLLGKVKTSAQLQGMDAEQMRDSVILGEAAYEVVQGYIAVVPTDVDRAPDQRRGSTEMDLLAAFLLEKMT